jgi:predicted KAP-like P-loop ATPase
MWFKRRGEKKEVPTASDATDPHPFSADRAIRTSAEDRLNRKGFAVAIGDAVGRWRHRDSLVVGIFGPWGVGKTSIVNMVREQLEKANNPPLIVEFSPWEWVGHQELAVAFFEEIEKSLPASDEPNAERAAEKVRKYALALHAGVALAESAAPVVAALSILVIVIGLGVGEVDGSLAKWGGRALAAVGSVGVIASQATTVMARLADFLDHRSTRPEASLAAVKTELGQALREFGTTIVVVVDDIDRLTPPDTVRMLQIIKANADLPGVVVLLACDPEAVAKSIEAALHVDGRGYLEKVVQVGLDVPSPDALELESLLIEGINTATAPKPINGRFDNDRWSELYASGLIAYLTTPRHVIRFAAMAEFGLRRYLDGEECNVDPVDFLGIELLREFEPDLYHVIRMGKAVLTGRSVGDTHDQRETAREIEPILRLARGSKSAPAAERIVRQLFPPAEWISTGMGQDPDRNRTLDTHRISHDQMFDRYFQFTVPSHDLSDGELMATVQLAGGSPSEFVLALRSLMERGLMRMFLIRLRAGIDRVSSEVEVNLIAGLFDVGDELEGPVEAGLGVSELLHAMFLIETLLERRPRAERVQILR